MGHDFFCKITHPCVTHDPFICVTELIYRYEVSRSYVIYSKMYYEYTGISNLFAKSFIQCNTRYFYVVWHDSCICMKILAHTWYIGKYFTNIHGSVIHLYSHSSTGNTWPIHLCGMTYSYVWSASRHTHEWVMSLVWVTSHIWMSHVFRLNKSCLTSEWVMSHTWISHVSYGHAAQMN